MSPVLQANNITYQHTPHGGLALANISLQVEPGEWLGIIGPNGAGKSTLIRILSGIISNHSGDVTIHGQPLSQLSRREIARKVALVPQTESTDSSFTVRQMVSMGRAPYTSWSGALSAHDEQVIARSIALCELTEFQHQTLHTLSGGEHKRVLLARALAQEPKLLLLDEPTAFLDIRHQMTMCEIAYRCAKTDKTAVIAVLHDFNIAAQFCDRVLVLNQGNLVIEGPTKNVLTADVVRKVFGTNLVPVSLCDDITGFVPIRNRA